MVLLAVAGTVAAVCLYRRMDEEIRRRAVAQIAKHYPGLKVAVGSAQLVEGKGVRVYDVAIVEPGAEGPQPELLRIEEMLLECPTDWKQLIQGDLPVRRVTVRRPMLRVTRRPDGTWSVAKLLQSAHCAGPSPPVTVENGVIEIFDPLKTPPATLTLRDVNLSITPADAVARRCRPTPRDCGRGENAATPPRRSRGALAGSVRRLQGMFAGDGFRRVEVEGSFDPGTRAFSIRGRAEGVEVSPELRDGLARGAFQEALGAGEFELRGQADLGFEVALRPGGSPAAAVQRVGAAGAGADRHPRLPHAMTEIRAAVQVDNGGLSIDDLTARIGQGGLRMSYRQSGFEPASPRLLTAELRQLELDRGLWDILPPVLAGAMAEVPPRRRDRRRRAAGLRRPGLAAASRRAVLERLLYALQVPLPAGTRPRNRRPEGRPAQARPDGLRRHPAGASDGRGRASVFRPDRLVRGQGGRDSAGRGAAGRLARETARAWSARSMPAAR